MAKFQIIDWFKNIQQKSLYTFTIFDIQEFYPSITEKLLKHVLAFAQRYVEIKQNELDLIFHTRKSLLLLQRHTVDTKSRKDGI